MRIKLDKYVLGASGAGLAVGFVAAVLVATQAPTAAEGIAAPQPLTQVRAAATASPETPAQTEPAVDEGAGAKARSAAVADAVRALAEAHAALHAEVDLQTLDVALKDALDAVFDDDPELRKLAREIYVATGVGRSVTGGRLTELGRAIKQRFDVLDLHGLDTAPYRPLLLTKLLAPVASASAAPAPAPGQRTLSTLLDEPVFDAERATRRLSALAEPPDAAAIEAAVATAEAANNQVQAADLLPDAALLRAIIHMVLDFEHVKRAGPFELRTARTLLARDRERAKILKRIVGIIDADDPAGAVASLDPPHPQYSAMLAAHERYRAFAKNTCPELVSSWKIRPGMKGEEIKVLQRRLACEGYYDGPIDGVFEGPALAGAKRYQRHHEMKADGMVFKGTIASMNVPLAKRIEQLRLALQRMRESDIGEMGEFFMRVNLPSFEVQVYDKGEVVRRERVIVGTNRLDDDKARLVQGHLNRTKLFTTELYQIIVNPSWILPARVVNGELKGQLAKDPQYLDKNNIREKTLPDGKTVYVQGREGNVLGKVKFLLKQSNAIYLHDTDKRTLFREQRRDFSHGCVRVEHAVSLARWLLERDGTPESDMKRVFKADSFERGFTLKAPIDLITEYITVDISDEGLPIFLTDIYKYDRDFYDGNLPPFEETRWGGIRLRPGWVPQVSEATVNRWRAKGMSAPRDYDPERHGK